MCEHVGRISQADVVDHITPHHGDKRLFWSINNWQALCYAHHAQHKQQIDMRGYDPYTIDANGWPSDPRHPSNK
jgi:5-methylcytosine-specific restriction endonuclease McrA